MQEVEVMGSFGRKDALGEVGRLSIEPERCWLDSEAFFSCHLQPTESEHVHQEKLPRKPEKH